MSLPYDKRGRGMCLNCNDNFYVFPYHNIWQNNACSSKYCLCLPKQKRNLNSCIKTCNWSPRYIKLIVNTNSFRFRNRIVFQGHKNERVFNSNHVLQKMKEQQILTKAQTKQMFV